MRRRLVGIALALLSGCAGALPSGQTGSRPSAHVARLGHAHYFYTRSVFAQRQKKRPRIPSYYGTGPLGYSNGVLQTAPKAYLIFWGFANASDAAHDPDGMASYLTKFFAALPNSSWLNVVSQYYQTVGGVTTYVATPAVAFTGTYYDASPPPSTTFTELQAAEEALKVAGLVGYDANTNYIVVTPHGYTTDGFGSTFCAYHSWVTTSSSNALVYTVFPYVPDAGYGCGAGAVHNPGTIDGASIVSGHEAAEAITDPEPYGGWGDASDPPQEIADKCAWLDLQNTEFPNGQSFPTQPLFSNASTSCVQSYGASPTPSPSPTANVIANPGFETGKLKPWKTCRSDEKLPLAIADKQKPHGGSFDAYAGTLAGGKEPAGTTSLCQLVTVPPNAKLVVWTRGISNDTRAGVFQFVRLYDASGKLVKTLIKWNSNDKKWQKRQLSLAAYANAPYTIAFGVQGKRNARGRYIGLYIDDVSLAP